MSVCEMEVQSFGQESERPWETVQFEGLVKVLNMCGCACSCLCTCNVAADVLVSTQDTFMHEVGVLTPSR